MSAVQDVGPDVELIGLLFHRLVAGSLGDLLHGDGHLAGLLLELMVLCELLLHEGIRLLGELSAGIGLYLYPLLSQELHQSAQRNVKILYYFVCSYF